MYCIARFQEGVTLNPYEYLLDENDNMLEFNTKELAVNYFNNVTQSQLTIEQWEEEGIYIKPVESN